MENQIAIYEIYFARPGGLPGKPPQFPATERRQAVQAARDIFQKGGLAWIEVRRNVYDGEELVSHEVIYSRTADTEFNADGLD